MDSNLTKNRWLPPTWIRFLAVILIILGIFFRFVNIGQKSYGFDESFTSIRVSGYTEAEVVQRLSETQLRGIKELQKYQFPNAEKGVDGTIRGLALEEPQLPPLYFVLTRFWVQCFGSSVAVTRSFSAFISLLLLPCIYWLCLELFESPLIGWVTVVLVAVSPFHVLYAQEARPYSLWALTIVVSSASLLQAMRLNTRASWALYTITLVASFYCYLTSVLVAIAHGIYVVAIEKLRLSKTLTAYLVSLLLSIIGFFPWILVVIGHRSQAQHATSWRASLKPTLPELLQGWFRQPGRAFFDLNPSFHDPLVYRIILMLANFILLVLVAYSLYVLYRKTSQRIWLFIFTLIGATLLPLALRDLILGGILSITPRYLTPSYLGFELVVAYLLVTKFTSISSNIRQQKLWQFVPIAVVSVGVLCCAVISQADVWWNKGKVETLQDFREAAHIINQANNPLLISDDRTDTLMSVSYLLEPKVKILLIEPRCALLCSQGNSQSGSELTLPQIPEGYSDVFLFPSPTERLLRAIAKQQTYYIKVVAQLRDTILLKLEKAL